jgi:hypothetical protein
MAPPNTASGTVQSPIVPSAAISLAFQHHLQSHQQRYLQRHFQDLPLRKPIRP